MLSAVIDVPWMGVVIQMSLETAVFTHQDRGKCSSVGPVPGPTFDRTLGRIRRTLGRWTHSCPVLVPLMSGLAPPLPASETGQSHLLLLRT
jgi:hypothetical protein